MAIQKRKRPARAGESPRAAHYRYGVKWVYGGGTDGARHSMMLGDEWQAKQANAWLKGQGWRVTPEQLAEHLGYAEPEPDDNDDDVPTLAECVAAYIDRPGISDGTRKRYRTDAKRLGELGDVRVDRLTRKQVNQWLTAWRARGLSSGTMHRMVGALMGATKGHVDRDVWADASFPKTTEVEPVILTRGQVDALMATAKGTDLYMPVWLMAETGLRWGEMAGLTPRHIDHANAEVNVRQAVTQMMRRRHGFTPGSLKSSASRRDIPLRAALLDALTLHTERDDQDGPLFTQADHLAEPACWTYANYLRAWRQLCQRTEGVPDHTRIHDLRHSAAMRWLRGDEHGDNRVPIQTVSDMLGHGSLAVTHKMYTHITREDRRAILSAGLSV